MTSPETNPNDEVDQVLDAIGIWGPWQRKMFFLLGFFLIPGTFQVLVLTFINADQVGNSITLLLINFRPKFVCFIISTVDAFLSILQCPPPFQFWGYLEKREVNFTKVVDIEIYYLQGDMMAHW